MKSRICCVRELYLVTSSLLVETSSQNCFILEVPQLLLSIETPPWGLDGSRVYMPNVCPLRKPFGAYDLDTRTRFYLHLSSFRSTSLHFQFSMSKTKMEPTLCVWSEHKPSIEWACRGQSLTRHFGICLYRPAVTTYLQLVNSGCSRLTALTACVA
jgi:hypothetical protein